MLLCFQFLSKFYHFWQLCLSRLTLQTCFLMVYSISLFSFATGLVSQYSAVFSFGYSFWGKEQSLTWERTVIWLSSMFCKWLLFVEALSTFHCLLTAPGHSCSTLHDLAERPSATAVVTSPRILPLFWWDKALPLMDEDCAMTEVQDREPGHALSSPQLCHLLLRDLSYSVFHFSHNILC